MLTLSIAGGDIWQRPHDEESQRAMEHFVRRAESHGVQGRCVTCAFRRGTEANASRLVEHLIERCLVDEGNNFMCHEPAKEDRVCAGYAALRDSFPTNDSSQPSSKEP